MGVEIRVEGLGNETYRLRLEASMKEWEGVPEERIEEAKRAAAMINSPLAKAMLAEQLRKQGLELKELKASFRDLTFTLAVAVKVPKEKLAKLSTSTAPTMVPGISPTTVPPGLENLTQRLSGVRYANLSSLDFTVSFSRAEALSQHKIA